MYSYTHMSPEEESLLRQLFLIRYTSLLKKIQEHIPVSEETLETLKKTILRIDWIDAHIK